MWCGKKKEKIETVRYEDVREERREGWRDEEVTMMERNERKKGEKHCQKKKDQEKERERESSRLVFPSRYDLCHQLPSVFPHHFITIRPPLSPLTSQETLHYFLIHFSLSLFILAFPGLKCSAWLQLRSCDTIRDTSSLTTLTHSVQRHRKRLGRRRSSITVTDKMTDKW